MRVSDREGSKRARASTNLGVDGARLWADIMALARITDPAAPYTRRSFSQLFLEGRQWLAGRFAQAGLATRIDTAGNLIGRVEGSDPRAGTMIIGSHSDTVPSGGRFDGIAGVVAGLEIARVLRERGLVLRHALEIVDFLAEEPSEYGVSCVGSRGLCGKLSAGAASVLECARREARRGPRPCRRRCEPSRASAALGHQGCLRIAHRARHHPRELAASMSASSRRSSASRASRSSSRGRPAMRAQPRCTAATTRSSPPPG